MRRTKTHPPIKQRNTKIKFLKFKIPFTDEEVSFYQAKIRWLTLEELFFHEFETKTDYCIATTTGIYSLNKKSGEFGRMKERGLKGCTNPEELTYYEAGKHASVNSGKYSDVTTLMIQQIRGTYDKTLQEIAEIHSISITTVYNIINYKTPYNNR